jgi:hypothetical protein
MKKENNLNLNNLSPKDIDNLIISLESLRLAGANVGELNKVIFNLLSTEPVNIPKKDQDKGHFR